MTQSGELAVIAMSKELGRAEARGIDKAMPHQVCHRFFSSSGETSDLAKHLRTNGFSIFEDDGAPLLEARRSESLDYNSLEVLVRRMCDLADRFAAEYDGLTLEE